MKITRFLILVVGGAVLFGGVIGFTKFRDKMIADYFANQKPPVIAVTAEPVIAEEWEVSVPAVGTLSAINGVSVSAAVSGQVRQIFFESGDTVMAGESLVVLDDSEERAEIAYMEARVDQARLVEDRSRKLASANAGTRANLDDAMAARRIAEAQVDQARAHVAKLIIRAPFSGQLGLRQVDLGEYVSAGQTLVDLQDLTVILAEFAVSQRDLDRIVLGASLTLTTDAWADRAFEGTVTAIAPKADPDTGMIQVEGRFPNPDGLLRPGMFARVKAVQPDKQRVITVPATAVSYSLAGDAVFVVTEVPVPESDAKQGDAAGDGDGDGESDTPAGSSAGGTLAPPQDQGDATAEPKTMEVAKRVLVTLGERRGDRIAVAKGLEEGDLVVTSGQIKLQDGSRLEINDLSLNEAAENLAAGSGQDE